MTEGSITKCEKKTWLPKQKKNQTNGKIDQKNNAKNKKKKHSKKKGCTSSAPDSKT